MDASAFVDTAWQGLERTTLPLALKHSTPPNWPGSRHLHVHANGHDWCRLPTQPGPAVSGFAFFFSSPLQR